jgi:methionine-rich copper-binding protein CopC
MNTTTATPLVKTSAPRRMAVARRMLGSAMAGLLLLAGITAPAGAHSSVNTTVTHGAVLAKAPARAQIGFGETVTGARATLLHATPGSNTVRTRWKASAASTRALGKPAPTDAGVYALLWRATAGDGDRQSGILAYQVGKAGTAKPATRSATMGTASIKVRVSDTRPGSMATVKITVTGGTLAGGFITLQGWQDYPVSVGKDGTAVIARIAPATLRVLVSIPGSSGGAVNIKL